VGQSGRIVSAGGAGEERGHDVRGVAVVQDSSAAKAPSCLIESGLDRRVHGKQTGQMIFGSHVVLFSTDADADRAFLDRVFGLEHLDAGGGWMIFDLPPAEAAVHPSDVGGAQLYFMCDDLEVEIRRLAEIGVQCSPIENARWGSVTMIRLPGGGDVGLYRPTHPTMVERH
jgi:catechol 2,3-dioxygenase-like lactoylglutathione lyase family enzyme